MTLHTSLNTPVRTRRLIVSLALVTLMLLAALPTSPATSHAQGDLPTSARLNGLIHTYQTWNNCGPANLTMAMSYYGWTQPQATAAGYLKPNPEDKNVSPAEMVAFVNQQQQSLQIGALWRYGGDMNLIRRAIAAGFPVIVESGYDVDDLGWMGHYETVVAYDDASQTVWVYDSYLGYGDGYGMLHSYAEFDSWWRHFNRAVIILFPIDQTDAVRDVLGPYVEPEYAANTALQTALTEAAANEADGWAWFNAGTSSVRMGNYYDAAIYYDEAFAQGLPYRLMWYMYGPYEAYYNVGRYNDVIELANNTESTTQYVEEIYYWRAMAYAALGRTNEALNELDRAIRFNPNFTAAQDARALIQNGQYVSPGAPVS